MKSIDEVVEEKLCDIVNCVLAKFIKPDIKLSDIKQLTEDDIIKLKIENGIHGMILDVDKTIRKNMGKIPKCNQEWIDTVRKHLRIVVVSNGKDDEVGHFFEDRDIGYITFAFKPLSIGFKKACDEMQLLPSQVIVVGDSLWDDICGGKKMKMQTALVKSVFDDFDIKHRKHKKETSPKNPDIDR